MPSSRAILRLEYPRSRSALIASLVVMGIKLAMTESLSPNRDWLVNHGFFDP
jgi:hydrogenase/urease accessory protein HupE